MFTITRAINFQMIGAAMHIFLLCLAIVVLGFEYAMYCYGVYHLVMQVIGGVAAVKIYSFLQKEKLL
jgi:hypothetical protein